MTASTRKCGLRQWLRKRMWYVVVAGISIGTGFVIGRWPFQFNFVLNTTAPFLGSLPKSLHQETVMAIGGSAAHGWADPANNSYLRRAFQSLSDTTNTEFIYDDRTMVGGSPVSIANHTLSAWLATDHPQVVVISWGLLNDISNHTPPAQFEAAIKSEVSLSLHAHAVVIFVTPAAVEASINNAAFNQYLAHEYAVAESFHNSNVYWLNLNKYMNLYLQAHGQDIALYAGGTWHPNEAGHELGGELLFNELIETFGSKPIEFQKRVNLIAHLRQGLINPKKP